MAAAATAPTAALVWWVWESLIDTAGGLAAAALDEPDRRAAGRLLRTTLGELDGQALPGVRDQGSFARPETDVLECSRDVCRECATRACSQACL